MSEPKRDHLRKPGWRHLPLSAKVPLSLGALLALILGAMSLVAFVQVRRSAIAVASERLDRVTQQLGELLTAGWRQRFATVQSLANSRRIVDYLRAPGAASETAALDSLRAYATRGGATLAAAEVWDSMTSVDMTALARSSRSTSSASKSLSSRSDAVMRHRIMH